MPIKNPASQYLKSLKTKYPVQRSKRSAPSPINSYLSQDEFKLMLPAKLKDSVTVKGATSDISKIFYYLIILSSNLFAILFVKLRL
jgi:hypothetical protein